MLLDTFILISMIFMVAIVFVFAAFAYFADKRRENQLAAAALISMLIIFAHVLFVEVKIKQSKIAIPQTIVYTDRKQSCQIIENNEAVWLKSEKEYITNLRDYRVDKNTDPVFQWFIDIQKPDEYRLVYNIDGAEISKLKVVTND